jgi:hypothetical protein
MLQVAFGIAAETAHLRLVYLYIRPDLPGWQISLLKMFPSNEG